MEGSKRKPIREVEVTTVFHVLLPLLLPATPLLIPLLVCTPPWTPWNVTTLSNGRIKFISTFRRRRRH